MKKMNLSKFLLLLSSLMCMGTVSYAQSNDNEDEVVKIERHNYHASMPNQLIIKFHDGAGVRRSETKSTRFKFPNNTKAENSVNSILDKYNVEAIDCLGKEQTAKTKAGYWQARSVKSFNGGDVWDKDISQMFLITLDENSLQSQTQNHLALIEELKQDESIEFAEPNYIQYALGMENEGSYNAETIPYYNIDGGKYPNQSIQDKTSVKSYTEGTPDDPMYSQQWGIPATHLDELWQKPKLEGAKRKVIAIVDTGVDIDHPDLKDNIWTNTKEANGIEGEDDDNNGFKDDIHGWDFVNQTGDMHDFNSHGTHCAGIAAAVGDNGIGITGANPDALIMPVAVMQSNGSGDVATIIKGINYATENGADIISMSLGGYSYSVAEEQALAHAYQSAVLVAAAGNDGKHIDPHCCPQPTMHGKEDEPCYPAAFTFVFGVQATYNDGGLATFSNIDCDGATFSQYGEEQLYNYELSAPGVNILSTVPNGGYKNMNGTSMACPLVAGGISALLDRQEYATKELLFANLINWVDEFTPVNFIKAYDNIDKLPVKFQFVTYEVNDTLYGDGSMYADAGERLQIYPTIRTVGAAADSITVWLEFQEYEDTTLFTFNSNYVDFGHSISAYAKAKSANPIDITLRENITDGRVMSLVLCAASPKSEDTMRYKFAMYVTNGVKLHKMLDGNDTLWPNVQYIVETLAVPAGDTLVIMPGTTLKMLSSSQITSQGVILAIGKPDSMITITKRDLIGGYYKLDLFNYQNKFEYCIIEYARSITIDTLNHSIIQYCSAGRYDYPEIGGRSWRYNTIMRNDRPILGTYHGSSTDLYNGNELWFNRYSNFDVPTNERSFYNTWLPINCNYILNQSYIVGDSRTLIVGTEYLRANYYGISTEKVLRKHIKDFYTNDGSIALDLSKVAKQPYSEAHGIVWKVEVNGHDAQDEFDSIPPLGVGTHEFKVYFNRAMDTAIAPMVAMGVRPPYTQTAIGENASWSEDSTIYTCYKTLTGKDAIDGLNRIYVDGAKDNEHFEIPYENQRFNVYVESSGSMSAGFQATAGLGRVELEWNNQEMNVDDFLGFNMYRYQYNKMQITDEDTVYLPGDTTMINTSLIVDTLFTDYDVVPGERYYYYYKILRTLLDENSPSKTVSSMPLSSVKGDANGSMSVDVADIITTINYVTNQNPQPFIFEAADVNGDGTIDVLDIVGIINIIMGNTTGSKAGSEITALYSIENDTLFVDSPVPMGGVQFSFTTDRIQSLESLSQFEQIKQWTAEDNYMFMAYSLSGKQLPAGKNAIVKLNGADISKIILADTKGKNLIPIKADQTGLTDVATLQSAIMQTYPNPSKDNFTVTFAVGDKTIKSATLTFTDITGRVLNVKEFNINSTGEYSYNWNAEGLQNGMYFVQLRVDGQLAHTKKLIKNK